MTQFGQGRSAEGIALMSGMGELGNLVCLEQPLLDARALGAEPLEVTMLSVATLLQPGCRYDALPWPVVASRGAGPVLAAREAIGLDKLTDRKTVTPGPTMTESLVSTSLLPTFYELQQPEGGLEASVTTGAADAGLLCGHGQCDLEALGLVALEDIGARFAKYQAGLPLPLRVIAIRSDVMGALREPVEAALRNAMERLASDRASVVGACAEALDARPAAVEAYLGRVLDPEVRLDAPEYRDALDVLREYGEADYYAANGRF